MATRAPLPLEGILVLAIGQAVAAPFCSARLAGARVIKIERPERDFAREYDEVVHGQSSYFVWLNGGKESLTVDLASNDGKETLHALLSRADGFVENLKPGALRRLGFDVEELRRPHPRLIARSIRVDRVMVDEAVRIRGHDILARSRRFHP